MPLALEKFEIFSMLYNGFYGNNLYFLYLNAMIKVGITGGIGSGKTSVCQVFERLGAAVYYADVRAKQLMEEDKELIVSIKKLIGEDAYNEDGTLNRKLIADTVFSDEKKLLQLNSLVHPAVVRDYESWNEILARKNYPYSIKEAALLIEAGSYKQCDKLIVVTADIEARIRRVMTRDNVTREQVLARINAQLPEEEKVKLADYVIRNDEIMDLVPQVTKIHLELTRAQ